MLVLLVTFLLLCLGFKTQQTEKLRQLGVRLNVILVAISVVMYLLWHALNAYLPAASTVGHLRMVFICMVGLLSMLLSAVAAMKNLSGVRSRVVAVLSIAIGLLHLVNLVVSLPVS